MLKLLHTKLDKPKLLTTFPNNSTGNDGDIVISTISGKGTYICVKSNGRWYAANKMEDLSNIGKSSFNKLLLKKLTVKEVENAGSDTDKFLVLDSGNQLKFRTGSETLSDIGALGSLSDTPLKIKESADAVADTAGYGQIWVDTATPNELAFTDDAGTDIIGIGKYHYETKFIGFFNYITSHWYILCSLTCIKTYKLCFVMILTNTNYICTCIICKC